jgi:hypothetical protein
MLFPLPISQFWAGHEPLYMQKNLKLMSAVAPLESPADIDRLAEAILMILDNRDGQTKAFIR